MIAALLVITNRLGTARDSDGEAGKSSGIEVRPDAPHLQGTLIVKLKAGILNSRASMFFGIASLDNVLSRLELTSRRSLFPVAPYGGDGLFKQAAPDEQGFDRVYVLTYSFSVDIYNAIEELMATGTLEYAEPYYIFDLFYTPNDPTLSQQYALNLIQMTKAWDITKGDSTVAIAVCDAGVQWDHPDLSANIWENSGETGLDEFNRDKKSNGIDDDHNGVVDDWHGWDLVGDPKTANDWQSLRWSPDNNPAPRRVNVSGYRGYHGTWVSGSASARTDNGVGIAGPGFRTKILPVKCSADSIGTGSVVAGYDGIRYAADMKAAIINCSFGGAVEPAFTQGFQGVIDYAYSKGSLVVAASGNEATNNDQTPIFPANLNHVLSVGATNSSDAPAGFSGYGVSVDIWAPGVNITTTDLGGGYVSSGVSGTSFATPIVAGVAALLRAQRPDWNPDQLAMQLRVTGDAISGGGPTRYRRLNAYRALTINRNLAEVNPDNLPGVGLVSYAITGETDDTLNGIGDEVTVRLNLRNYLAPTKNLRIDPYKNGELTTDGPISVQTMGTLEDRSVTLTVRVDPDAQVVYSEGRLQLILKLTDGAYEDYIALLVPVALPGWKQQLDPVAANTGFQYVGTDVVATSPRAAWAVSNVQLSQTTFLPLFSRNPLGNQWNGLNQFNVNGGALQVGIFALAAVDASTAWVGSGPSTGQASIFRTANGGAIWTETSVASITPFVNGIYFWNANEGIFFGDPLNGTWGIGITSDGGQTWKPLQKPLAALSGSEAGWANGFAVYGDNAWFGTNESRIWRSTDRGRTWVPILAPSVNAFDMDFINENQGMAVFRIRQGNVGTNAIGLTQNAGETWESAPLPFAGAEPQGVAAVRGTDRFFVGTQRGVYQTTDFGQTWKQMAMPLMQFTDILLAAQIDSTGELGAYGTNAFSQLMVYRELPADTTSDTSTTAVPYLGNAATSSSAGRLYTPLPNPAHGPTEAAFDLYRSASVRLALYDPAGREVLLLRQGRMEPGSYRAAFNTAELPSGVCFLRLEIDGVSLVRQVVVVR